MTLYLLLTMPFYRRGYVKKTTGFGQSVQTLKIYGIFLGFLQRFQKTEIPDHQVAEALVIYFLRMLEPIGKCRDRAGRRQLKGELPVVDGRVGVLEPPIQMFYWSSDMDSSVANSSWVTGAALRRMSLKRRSSSSSMSCVVLS